MTTGMEGFAAGAKALSGRADGLRAAVDSGQLVMDPEAAERVAKVYEDKADEVLKQIGRTDRLAASNSYGDCRTGQQLEEKFREKVNAPKVGLAAVLTEARKVLLDMAQTFRDSARETQSGDDEIARNMNRTV